MTSSTSSIMHHLCAFRNPEVNANSYNCGHVALAQLGYIVIIPYALVEAAISQFVKAIAYCVQINQERYEKIDEWASSSVTALLWNAHCVAINFFVLRMSATENEFSVSVLKNDPPPDLLQVPASVPHPQRPDPAPNPDVIDEDEDEDLDPVPTPDPVPVRPNPVSRPIFQALNDDALPDDVFEQLLAMNALHEDKPDAPADQGGKKPEVINPVKPAPAQGIPPTEILPPQPVQPPKPVIKLDRIKPPADPEKLNLTVVEEDVRKLVNSYKVAPIKIQDDESSPTKIIDVRAMLKKYELGDSAVSYTEYYDCICRELPDFTDLDNDNLQINLLELCRVKEGDRFAIRDTLQLIAAANPRSPEDERFVKMLISVYKTVVESNDESEMEIMRGCLLDANEYCKVRQTDEILRLFIKFVAPRYNINISSEDCLVFEYMQHRIRLREILLNILDCLNTHDRNFLSKELYNFFYLPKPSIVVEEGMTWGYNKRTGRRLKTAFRQCYDTTEAIYTIFTGLLYPKPGEKFNYKPDMFIDWLKDNKLAQDAFADDMCTIYRPELIIRYLVETGFLKPKA